MRQYVVLISGATATGKSSLAIELAQKISGEIINADIGSFYTPLTIGTAKPDFLNEPVPHHFFNILDKPENFTVVQFRQQLKIKLQEIWDRGNVPIVVGGSAFYIKSFFYKQHDIEGTNDWIQELERSVLSSSELWKELQSIDPQRATQINPSDRYRIIRALSIFKATGQKPSLFAQEFQPLAPFYFIVCTRDRKELYKRIDERVIEMMNSGFRQEVENLRGSAWESFLQKKKLIGYDDLLENKNDHDVTPIIQKKTRNYAKRQIIFLHKLQQQLQQALNSGDLVGCVQEINLTLYDVCLYINGLSEQILKTFL
ncbi:MAG TPA: tRNA (adenosine(37)-N6)-dimethylallyltransferase MiaA [Candidatus Saccharimonadales bacterium]|nr:tRNA (adenosine(37)-N6)-dimethylallyltransferase MiaA [Candidatus Saccharimonadales bacterium]